MNRKQEPEGRCRRGEVAPYRAKTTGPLRAKIDIKQLERENARLQRKLRQAEIIIEFQKKLATALGIPMGTPETDEND